MYAKDMPKYMNVCMYLCMYVETHISIHKYTSIYIDNMNETHIYIYIHTRTYSAAQGFYFIFPQQPKMSTHKLQLGLKRENGPAQV
jgi:hypothetical protein